MIPGLLVTEGPKKGLFLQLPNKKPFWIGRAENANFIPENNPSISGKHCYFLRKDSELAIKDDSLNGTRLNGRILNHQIALLKNADLICVGNTHLQVVDLSYSPNLETQFDIEACMEDIKKRRESSNSPEMLDGVGPYINIDVLGKGAFSLVFKAIHEEEKKVVALKVFSELEGAELEFIGRFFREIDILKKLDHPHIIKLYNHCYSIEDGSDSYIALEYFQGIDLHDYIDSYGPMEWEKVCVILFQSLQALEYMHNLKILHRDIKPNNIMFNQSKGIAKIIDLGLGKCLQLEERKTFFTTRPNSTIGTPNFMPIEQWSDFKQLDERADIYSLGATAYFLLSAIYPYKKNQNLVDLYTQILQRKLKPLEEICPPEAPKKFLKIVKKMMAYNAEDRYDNATKAIAELSDFAKQVALKL